MSMDGRQILVVGGSSGMGLATARAAALEGAHVTIASSRQDRVDTALRELPDGCVGIAVDVRDETQVATALQRFGTVDHLVFTAGDGFTPQRLAELDLAEAQSTLAVRFWGAVTVIKHAVTRLSPTGSITLTTGTVAQRPMSGATLAAAGAGAAEALVKGLAVELAPVRVNAVRAGAIRTPMWDRVPRSQRAAIFTRLAQNTLVGSVGEPEHIAMAHLYLMRNGYVTGAVLDVNGGSLLTAA